MSDSHAVDIDHHVKIYMMVFAALAVLTIVTVAVSYLHVTVGMAVAIALVIATIKGSLVACYFMHLISEKRLIYIVLVMTVLFFFFALLIPTLTESQSIDVGSPLVPASANAADHDG